MIHIGDGSFFNAKRKQTTDILSGPNQTLQLTSAAVSVPAWFKLPLWRRPQLSCVVRPLMYSYAYRMGVFVALSLASLPSFAMKCKLVDPERVVSAAEIAFVGRVSSVTPSEYAPSAVCKHKPGGRCGGKIATLKVMKNLRGQTAPEVTVLAEDACNCLGAYFNHGAEYLVIASPNSTPFAADFLAKNVCWGTGQVARKHSQKIIELLSAPQRD